MMTNSLSAVYHVVLMGWLSSIEVGGKQSNDEHIGIESEEEASLE
jgi:hypothetical protein